MTIKENNKSFILKQKSEDFLNMDIEETLNNLGEYSIHMVRVIEMLIKYQAIKNDVILNKNVFNRYKGLAISLSFPYENFKKYISQSVQFENQEEELCAVEKGLLIQTWASLGSILESTLQIFLTVYLEDYLKSSWNKWDEKVIVQLDDVIERLDNDLKKLVEKKENLDGKTRKSFIKEVKNITSRKSKMPEIDQISLSDLINFVYIEEVFNKNCEYNKKDLDQIREYRNAIHSFQNREIGNWEEVKDYAKLVLLLIIDISARLPFLPDEAPIDNWYYKEETRFNLQLEKWFKLEYILS